LANTRDQPLELDSGYDDGDKVFVESRNRAKRRRGMDGSVPAINYRVVNTQLEKK